MAEIKDYNVVAGSNDGASPGGFAEGAAPSVTNNVWRETAARLKRLWTDDHAVTSLGGGTTAYTLAASQTISAYAAGDHFAVVCNATNTGAVTLDVDSVGVKSVVTTSQTALAAGQLVINGIYIFSYDATSDVFIVLNPNLEIHDQTAVTTLGDANFIPVHDGAQKKITVANARLQLSSEIATSFNVLLTTDITGNSSGTWTTVNSTWGTERWDAAGTFSGYKWTPGAAGKYFLHAAMPLRGAATTLAADTDFGIRILQRNSSDTILTAIANHQSTSVGGNVVARVSGSIADSANDNYYEVQAFVTTANWETYAATGQGVFGGWRMF